MKKIKFPSIGLRMFKSFIGVLLSFVIYYLRGKQGTPFYTCIAVLQCMRNESEDVKVISIQRITGTLIGSLYGLVMIMLFNDTVEMTRYIIISIFIIPIIYTAILTHKSNAAYFACVVFLSITINHLSDSDPYLFVYNRAMDTLIGIFLSIIINRFRLPRQKRQDILFVSTMDETLLTMQNTITPYSRYHLNRMLEDGMNFTIASMRTPATLKENLQGIKLKLPVIAMDGAVLFDMNKNQYLKKQELSYQEALVLIKCIQQLNYHVFCNVIQEDSWIIYYGDFKNDVEQAIYTNSRTSPYRNHIKAPLPPNLPVLYLMVIDEITKIDSLYQILDQTFDLSQYKILKYLSKDYPNYAYIKIYHKEATKQNMLSILKKSLQKKQVITFGSIAGQYDYLIKNNDSNQVIKLLKKLYEPVKIFKRPYN